MVFAGLVAILAVVGIYLTVGGPGTSEETPASPAAAQRQEVGEGGASPAVPQTPLATASQAPFDIYSFLPMSKQELAAAADVARRFTEAYGTYRFDEDPGAYAQRLRAFTTTELGDELARAVSAPGTVEQNRTDQLVAQGSATVKQIREVDETSVIFVVTGVQNVTSTSGPQQRSADYAVTLTQVGSDWRVYDLQPADAGQEGDPSGGVE